jgi:hypothetical protein
MNDTLNTPCEILKRLLYVLYVGSLFFGFVFGIMGLFGQAPDALLTAAVLALSAVVLKVLGARLCEFHRLADSFPMGSPEDVLSTEAKQTFAQLIVSFHETTDWASRQAIRRRISKMVQSEPLLLDVFEKEIAKLHPTLFYESQSRLKQ